VQAVQQVRQLPRSCMASASRRDFPKGTPHDV
jgi:hypothetical protein